MNDVNKCYKLKLFFQQFFVNTAVLNAEVPLNSRLHILEVSGRYLSAPHESLFMISVLTSRLLPFRTGV